MSLASLVWLGGCGKGNDASTNSTDTTTDSRPSEGTQDDPQEPKPLDRDAEIANSQTLIGSGKLDEASEVLRKLLLANPADVEVLFRLANIQASQGDLSYAVELLDSIPPDHPEAGLPAIGQSADWCMMLERYDDAERKYKTILERIPSAAVAHRQLAYLFNRQGRRHEAAEHIHALCRAGDVRQDELHALMVLGNAVYQDRSIQPPAGERPYWPIGAAAEARKLFTDYKFDEAADALHARIESGKARPSVLAFYGRIAAELQDDERFLWWLGKTDEETKEFSEYWAAVGAYLHNQRRFKEAARALAEALDRDPTDATSMRRMHETLLALKRPEDAEKWFDRFSTIRETTLASNRIGAASPPNPNDFVVVSDGLNKLARPLEAVMWELSSAFYARKSPEQLQEIGVKRQKVIDSGSAFPGEADRLCGLRKSEFPLAELKGKDTGDIAFQAQPGLNAVRKPVFANVAKSVGLQHAYSIAASPQPFQFALYQSLGGGVAVTDYDLDGWPDLYFAQGASDPPAFATSESNLLYRSVDQKLSDVTVASGTGSTEYSIGATSGDWNQDGFPDLVVTSIGETKLLTNNGDGTFSTTLLFTSEDNAVLPSSVAMADVSGDSLPDIIELRYVSDATMLDKPKLDANGNVIVVAPADYTPAKDALYINDGKGGFESRFILDSDSSASTGLGVLVTDFDGKPGNEIFVGNDIRANHYWIRGEGKQWNDLAPVLGCAFGNGGITTASMGVATADFDQSGTPDIHVTNFLLEPVCLYLNLGASFQDRAIQYRLATESRSVLGFGTQAIDYDNEGDHDLVVTNGHIEKPANPDEPFHQRPQLFANVGQRFQLTEVEEDSGYWESLHLGRGLATLDFDRNGKTDIVVTHIGSPSALLLNQTPSGHHWLNLRLAGTSVERDVIGAKVTVRSGGKSWDSWVTGGDGYLAHNEDLLHFGLGALTEVDEVVVTWPDGQDETFSGFDVDQTFLLVQGQREPFRL